MVVEFKFEIRIFKFKVKLYYEFIYYESMMLGILKG